MSTFINYEIRSEEGEVISWGRAQDTPDTIAALREKGALTVLPEDVSPQKPTSRPFIAVADVMKVKENAEKAIISGFTSDALGTVYQYNSGELDQHNLVMASIVGGSIWVLGKTWTFVPHTPDQAKQVLADFVAFKDQQIAGQKEQIDAVLEAATPRP